MADSLLGDVREHATRERNANIQGADLSVRKLIERWCGKGSAGDRRPYADQTAFRVVDPLTPIGAYSEAARSSADDAVKETATAVTAKKTSSASPRKVRRISCPARRFPRLFAPRRYATTRLVIVRS